MVASRCLHLLGSVLVLVPALSAGASDQITGLFAIESVRRAFAEVAAGAVVELASGENGQPQPREWFLTVHDPGSPTTLHTFWTSRDRSTDEGANAEFYPANPPRGFILGTRLVKDSTDAFAAANAAADLAGIGFDSVSYRLRSREFSTEPVWELSLFDRRGHVAGTVAVSGETGTVLRTIWFRRGHPPEPVVEDSALPAVAGEGPAAPQPPQGAGPQAPTVAGPGNEVPQIEPVGD
jgi:hypothetical protein